MPSTGERVSDVRSALEPMTDPESAFRMAAYMKDHFPFLGVKSADVRTAIKPFTTEWKQLGESDLLDLADGLFAEAEREFAYVACLALRRYSRALTAGSLPRLRRIVQTKSWWDTVDSLATHPIGDVVRANPELSSTMDEWIHDHDIWVARTAILHQLMWKGETDAERLFHYCDVQAENREFFIRKALGWALRQYARTDPDAVRSYVHTNADRLSGLTKREALKRIGG